MDVEIDCVTETVILGCYVSGVCLPWNKSMPDGRPVAISTAQNRGLSL